MSSDEGSTDESIKRKRPIGDAGGENIFLKSRKTSRTPTKKAQSSETKLDQLLVIMKELQADIKDIKRENQEFSKEIKTLKMENQNDSIKQDNKKIRKKLAEAKSKIKRLDKERNEKNIVISGLDMNNMDLNSLKETMEKFILQHINIQIELKKVDKLTDKMCLIELKNLEDHATIMKNKAKLKQIKKVKVYINDDLSVIER
ncbi:hypothetical protein ILUMI_18397 [Ignelater luminosus]|uniref:Uncharacterized protein n=1 Tax=Ignelater luminosus TaxID=2038154 RepID=A0A8K0G6L2_IGNLU|nr:hypothetical protein ILUMI_18397 [Ignelater luminosus]